MTPLNPPTIEALTPDSPHLETIVTWQHESWGHLNPAMSFADRCAEVRSECGERGVPRVFMAMHAGKPVGTASLIESDMSSRPQLTPWLASVFVHPEWRGQGIASRLVRRVEEEARQAGLERFYLYTPDQQALYRRLGWQETEAVVYRGEAVTIMTRCLNDDAPAVRAGA
ncbi:acetyltransferase (GNAT) family protein [Modicisalibacter xianhensis]|uniref:Acetyltransferase (GNAT) family protein n=1 Tax=Modicisalibacter xianhensis TaxID=442341 RepID=A0A4R8G612_9GAMM|nr:GNAT family N-acetyltransferase [Halomonas xianhensis]TDX31588.1 acetyltransferase (GNAT) family protein [Halomonas xianhensis]